MKLVSRWRTAPRLFLLKRSKYFNVDLKRGKLSPSQVTAVPKEYFCLSLVWCRANRPTLHRPSWYRRIYPYWGAVLCYRLDKSQFRATQNRSSGAPIRATEFLNDIGSGSDFCSGFCIEYHAHIFWVLLYWRTLLSKWTLSSLFDGLLFRWKWFWMSCFGVSIHRNNFLECLSRLTV